VCHGFGRDRGYMGSLQALGSSQACGVVVAAPGVSVGVLVRA
jgi:hypothetical protein